MGSVCHITRMLLRYSFFFRFPESPAWLLANHKYKQTEAALRQMAKWNGVRMKDGPLLALVMFKVVSNPTCFSVLIGSDLKNYGWQYMVHKDALMWRHNGRDGISDHQPHDCLLNCLFRRRSKRTSNLRVTGSVRGIHRCPVNSPHKWPVTRKMFPLDDVIMACRPALVRFQLSCQVIVIHFLNLTFMDLNGADRQINRGDLV